MGEYLVLPVGLPVPIKQLHMSLSSWEILETLLEEWVD